MLYLFYVSDYYDDIVLLESPQPLYVIWNQWRLRTAVYPSEPYTGWEMGAFLEYLRDQSIEYTVVTVTSICTYEY